MAYTADSFTAGEQPTTAKWNELWNNDASFHDGTGIGNNAVAAASLATSAIKLGYAEITSNFVPGTNAETDITGVSVTVTVPAGGRDVKITAKVNCYNQNAGDHFTLKIKEGSTVLQTLEMNTPAINVVDTNQFSARVSAPSAGSHTYKVSIASGAAGTAVGASSTESAYILVEAI